MDSSNGGFNGGEYELGVGGCSGIWSGGHGCFGGLDGAGSSLEVGDLLAKSPCLSSSELSNL